VIQESIRGYLELNPFAYGMIVLYVPIRSAAGNKLNQFPHEKHWTGSRAESQAGRTADALLTNPPGHLWRDKWTALSGPLSQALNMSKTYSIDYPVRHGQVENWDHMERFWQQCIFKYLRSPPCLNRFPARGVRDVVAHTPCHHISRIMRLFNGSAQ